MEGNKPYKHSFQSVAEPLASSPCHHGGRRWGHSSPCLPVAPESSVSVPGSPDTQQQPKFPGLWAIWQQA